MPIDNVKDLQSVFGVKIITRDTGGKDDRIISIPSDLIMECFFIEDIFSISTTGKMIFLDPVGGIEQLPITGHEQLAVVFGSALEREMRFDIWSITNIEQIQQPESAAQSLIEIIFVDTHFQRLTQLEYSKSWTNTRISDIIKDITENMLYITSWGHFEETNETLPYFYMPYWTPVEAIRWLSERASSRENGTAGYLFYIIKEKANFVTMEKLFQQKNIEKTETDNVPLYYKFSQAAGGMGYVNALMDWNLSSIDKLSLSGLRGGHRMGYDFETKTFIDNSYNYTTSIRNYTMHGKRTLYPPLDYAGAKFTNTGENDSAVIDNIYNSEFIHRYSKQLALIATLMGHERREAGTMAYIEWPSTLPSEKVNKMMEGKYLIKSITHYLSAKAVPPYKNKVVFLRNAYTDCDNRTLTASTIVDIDVNVKAIGSRR